MRLALLVLVIGIAAVFVDKFLWKVPSPPEWLFAWAAWVAAGLALFAGGGVIRDLIRALLGGRSGENPGQKTL